MRKFFLVVCAAILLTSCTAQEPLPPPGTDALTETMEQTEPLSAGITAEALSFYRVIVDGDAGEKVQTVAESLGTYLAETHGIGVPLYADTQMAPRNYEILIGGTVRKESAQFTKTLRYSDYGWQMIGDKLVIAGHTDETTYKAVKKFMSELKKGTAPGVVYDGESSVTQGVYSIGAITAAGIPMGDFCLVVSADGMTEAERHMAELFGENLAEEIRIAGGYVLPMAETEGKHRIVLAKDETMAYGSSAIRAAQGDMYIMAGSLEALHQAIDTFAAYFSGVRAESVDIPAEIDVPDLSAKAEFTAMSYNIWVGGTGKGKQELVLRSVLKTLPDTVGFQEASPAWMAYLTEQLSPVYDYVGEGRDGGQNGEYSPVFYKRSLYTPVESGTKWLSDTPDTVSKVPESSLNRVFSYALLERKDGSRLMVVNTHLEHTSSAARVKQAQVLAAFLETVEYPILLTGDFNAEVDTPEYTVITQTGVVNTADAAEKRAYANTFTNFGSTGAVIDFIFVSGLTVRVHEIHEDLWGGEYPSDHNPVVIRYTADVSD